MSNKRCAARWLGVAVVMGVAFTLSACGGGTTTPSSQPSATPPPPPVKTVLMQASIGSLPVDYVAGNYFSTSATGTIDLTVDWTFADNTIHIWVAKGQCTFEQFEGDTCEYVTQSLVPRPKPRILSLPAAPAGVYTLIVANWGPRDESVSYQIVLTSASGASASNVRRESSGPAGFLHAWPRR